MSNPITLVQSVPTAWSGYTKGQLEALAIRAVDNILEEGDPLGMAERLSAMELFIKLVKADMRYTEYVRDELAKNGGRHTTASGAKIEAIEAGVNYDYSHNPGWLELNTAATEAVERRKALEARLRTIPAGKSLVDDDTGEALTETAKSSTSTYKITLKK